MLCVSEPKNTVREEIILNIVLSYVKDFGNAEWHGALYLAEVLFRQHCSLLQYRSMQKGNDFYNVHV